MKPIHLLLLLAPMADGAQKEMEIKTLIYRNTAAEAFPEFSFGAGSLAIVTISYDEQQQPEFTGQLLMNPDGSPRTDVAGELEYDRTVNPSSPTSNESRYSITGQIKVEIAGHLWTGSSCRILIYNDVPTATPFDGIFIECKLTAPQEMQNVETLFELQIRSSGIKSMIQSTVLPSTNDSLTNLNEASLNFSLRPNSGTRWVINSNALQQISISQPEN